MSRSQAADAAPEPKASKSLESNGFMRLRPKVQQYDWGVVGKKSFVGQLGKAGGALARLDDDEPYAELWVGVHPNGPSTIYVEKPDGGSAVGETTLVEYLREFPAQIGEGEDATQGLAFLLKLLSVGKALSIQAHPNKARAQVLFQTQPSIYKDPNHKPEMAYALTEFEALAGFQRLETISRHMDATPELVGLVAQDGGEAGVAALQAVKAAVHSGVDTEQRQALRALFSVVMRSDAANVSKRFKELYKRLRAREYVDVPHEPIHDLDNLALRLNEQFPLDVGIFCVYLMCYVKIPPGKAIFLAANEPHAYLSGDCVEIMANSDNVIRAGLTPKFKDVEELERMLTYSQAPTPGSVDSSSHHPSVLLDGVVRDKFCTVFSPPDPNVDDFQLERYARDDSHTRCKLPPSRYASLILVVDGRGEAKWSDGQERIPLFRGCAFFQPANTAVSISGEVVLFRATKKGAVSEA